MKNLFVILMVALIACKANPLGNKVKQPFAEKKYQSSKNYFRATGSGDSQDLNTSEEKAMLVAKQRLASGVQTTLRSVTDRYMNEREVSNRSETQEKFDQLIRESMSTTIADVAVIGKQTYEKNGIYTTYVALEANKDRLYERLEKNLANKEKMKAEIDKETFRKMFNEAMEKYGDD